MLQHYICMYMQCVYIKVDSFYYVDPTYIVYFKIFFVLKFI